MLFIKLTVALKEQEETYINPAKIIEMRPQEDGSTFIFYNGDDYTPVKETPREVIDIIRIEINLKEAMQRVERSL